MRAIVLAAGTGSRLGEVTKARTKGMVPVNGKKLIDYLLDFFDFKKISEVIVVGGFHFEDMKNHIEKKGMKNIKTIENKEFLKGNIFTLIRGLEEFKNDSFLITNVDHIYPSTMFKKMSKSFDSITAMCDFDRTLHDDDMKVKLKNGTERIEEISKNLEVFHCGYIGMTFVHASMESLYRYAINDAVQRYGDNAVVENVLQVLADNENTAPKICDLSGYTWYEVDTVKDLEKTEKKIIKDKNFR